MDFQESSYLQQMAELGETQAVVCTENIQSADGAKLLPKGARINRQVLKRLLSHKLLKPIDFTTRIENALDHRTLITLGLDLMARPSEMGTLLRMMRDETFIKRSCNRIHLELPIQNKLTVAQRLSPELLEHSLRVALTISLIGEQLGLPEQELEVLATARLLHDLGELHLGIGDLPLEQNLNLEYWQQVRSHPIIGGMILQQFPAYKPHVVRSVQEHHERLDGSGYPYGLKAIRISRGGRLLAFTELALGALRKYSLRQLSTIIKSNLDALDPQPVAVFRDALHLYQSSTREQPATIRKENLTTLFRLLTQLVASGEPIAALSSGTDPDEVCLLSPAIGKIRQGLRRAGFELDATETGLAMIGDDPEALIELEELLQESLFQLCKTLLEMHRRLGSLPSDRPGHTAIRQWLGETEQQLDEASQLLS